MESWGQIITIIATIVTTLAAIGGGIWWVIRHMDDKIKSVGTDIKDLASRMSEQINRLDTRTDILAKEMNARLNEQAKRSDQLYTMFIDLVKAK